MAMNEPNSYVFQYLNGSQVATGVELDDLVIGTENSHLINRISTYYNVSKENVKRYMVNTVIYTHGVATLIATGMLHDTMENYMDRLLYALDTFFRQETHLSVRIHESLEEK